MRTVDIPAEGRGVVPGTAVGVASMALLTAISVGAANVPAAAPSNAAATQQLRAWSSWAGYLNCDARGYWFSVCTHTYMVHLMKVLLFWRFTLLFWQFTLVNIFPARGEVSTRMVSTYSTLFTEILSEQYNQFIIQVHHVLLPRLQCKLNAIYRIIVAGSELLNCRYRVGIAIVSYNIRNLEI